MSVSLSGLASLFTLCPRRPFVLQYVSPISLSVCLCFQGLLRGAFLFLSLEFPWQQAVVSTMRNSSREVHRMASAQPLPISPSMCVYACVWNVSGDRLDMGHMF